jgi:chromosome segregation ATPase
MHILIRLSCSKSEKIDEKIHILKNEIETVKNDIQNLTDKSIRLENSLKHLNQECSLLQNNVRQQSTTINECKLNQDKTEQDLLEIKRKMEDLHYATHDGTLMWIVDDVKKKLSK